MSKKNQPSQDNFPAYRELTGRKILIKKPVFQAKTKSGIIMPDQKETEMSSADLNKLYQRVPVLAAGTDVVNPLLKEPGVEIFIDTMGLRTAELLLINDGNEDVIYMLIHENNVAIIW